MRLSPVCAEDEGDSPVRKKWGRKSGLQLDH